MAGNGLPVSRVIRVNMNLSPQAAQYANLNALLILGSSDVIDAAERLRSYDGDIAAVAADFGTSAPEYKAAALFFQQVPQPVDLKIGRWAEAATAGLLKGGLLSTAEQTLANWTAIEDGAFTISVDSVVKNVSALDFSGELNLNGVAATIDAALVGATCTWDGTRFIIKSDTTGATSIVSYATAPGAGTNIAALLKLTSGLASAPVVGVVAETPVACLEEFVNRFSSQFFAVTFADASITTEQHLAVAEFVEADQYHAYGITTQDSLVLDGTSTNDIGAQLKDLGYKFTVWQYSSSNPYAVASLLGRILTTDFNANNAVITLMFKQEPGIVAENLSSTQADVLAAKRGNVFVQYNNDTAIIQNGVTPSGIFFDSIYNAVWFRSRIQTDVWNLLYLNATKIPQTDAGMNIIKATIEADCAAAVRNGYLAPGTWPLEAAGFGTLKPGDFLPKGFYVYAPPVSEQSAADRQARKSVPFQVAALEAGAVHSVIINVNVSR
jgi:hypothetical protein